MIEIFERFKSIKNQSPVFTDNPFNKIHPQISVKISNVIKVFSFSDIFLLQFQYGLWQVWQKLHSSQHIVGQVQFLEVVKVSEKLDRK